MIRETLKGLKAPEEPKKHKLDDRNWYLKKCQDNRTDMFRFLQKGKTINLNWHNEKLGLKEK